MKTGQTTPYTEKRAIEILEVVMAYARMDFEKKTVISDKADVFDAISAGVNMLGEELQSSVLSLKEKEQLLQEIHHRVKNNMQIISSLLNLLTENQTDVIFLNLIKDSQNRIGAMALIHEMLYATSDFKFTNLFEYIGSLTKSLYTSYAPPGSLIKFHIEIDKNFYFEVDKMVPLGLILNEIICNSLKYAFPEKKGIISIELNEKEKKLCLSVSDNGIGLPAGFDPDIDGGLGIQLIFLLSKQISCKTDLEKMKDKGVRYILTLN